MKSSIKISLIAALFLFLGFNANAQRPGGGGGGGTPEEMAAKQTESMTEKLGLDNTQAAKVKDINLTYANKMHEAQEGNAANRSAMQEIASAINKEKAAELKAVLTAKQYKTYEQMEAERGKGKGKPGGGGKRGGK